MKTMRSICQAAALSALLAFPAGAGSVSVGTDVKYPTEFETRTQVINGKVTTITIPTRFETRRTGTSMKSGSLGVSRLVKKDSWGKDVVLLQFDEGPEAEVKTGETIEVEGVKYRALGWRGKDYCLMDLETRKVVKFRPFKADS